MDETRTNKWSITLTPLSLRTQQSGGYREATDTFVASKVEINGVLIRCTGAAMIMSPKAPLTLHLDVLPRDLKIIIEEPK